MEKFLGFDIFCGSNSSSNGKLESKFIKRIIIKRMKLKRDVFFKKEELEKI